MAATAFLLSGCNSGSDGAAGAPGAPGAAGQAGAAGNDLTAKVNVSTLTADQWSALAPTIDPASISVTIGSGKPVVKFKVTDASGLPVVGLGLQKKASTALVPSNYNLQFTLAKLVPGSNGDPSKWVNYLVTNPGTVASPATTGSYPRSDNTGTLVDNGDGTYQYTFWRDITATKAFVDALVDSGNNRKADLGDTTYVPTLTHRLGIIIDGSMPGTGNNTPDASTTTTAVPLVKTFNIGYDFVPAGGPVTATRDIVMKGSCSGCHDGKGIGHVSLTSSPGNAVGRNDPRLCVTCHTDQTKYGFAEVTKTATGYAGAYMMVNGKSAFDYPRMIHQTHMGDELVKTGYNLNGHCNDPRDTSGLYSSGKAVANSAQCFNTVGFPQDQRNCTKCHDGSATKSDGSTNANKTTNGDNWKNVPSQLACGACHDGINFQTGGGITLANRDADVAAGNPVGTTATGHIGGAKADNSQCALCHDATTIPIYHRTTVPSLNNPIVKDGVATFTYKISGVTINASKQVVVKFQILKNNAPVAFNTYAAGAVPITGFTGGPGFVVAYATAQDGITAPSDWNSGHDSASLTDVWAGANGNSLTLTDAASSTYTAVIAASTTGRSPSHSLALPGDAKMVTAMLAGSFTQPGVTDLGGVLPGIPAMMAATGNTPDGKPNVARRVVFSETKCNSCHDRLGTSPNFHGGNYSIAMCPACHTANQGGSTGWAASSRVWVHGIHSAGKRTVPFTWHAVSATDNYSTLNYPGLLKDCQQCHLPGTYDFSASQYTPALIAGMLNVQATTGKLNPASATAYVFPQAAPVGSGQWAYGLKVDNTTDYGTGNSINPATGSLVAQTTQGNNLVTSPITAVCSTCHDSSTATSHMEANGGSFYDPRNMAVTRTEQCLVCHGSGKIVDIKVVHQ